MEKISIIVSCYNEEKALPLFYKEIIEMEKDFDNVEFEYIFVNDGSEDDTLNIIKNFHKKDNRIRYISFSRNFGKESAMYAGLEASTGDYVVFMDADLQDPPSMLKDMFSGIKDEGYDCVATRRISRKGEPIIRSFFARLFYKLIHKISKTQMVEGARDYRIMTRQMANAVLAMREYNRYSKGLFNFVGFDTKWIEYKNVERVSGKTKWSFGNLFKYALEGITSFSTAPLVLASIIGCMFCLVAFFFIMLIIIKTIVFGDPTSGWPSLACIIVFVSGVQLFATGVVGQYLAKTYMEVKQRPLYIVKETEKDYKRKDM